MEQEAQNQAQRLLSEILDLLQLTYTLQVTEKDDDGRSIIEINIETAEPGFIIGYHGQTLQDLEFLVNLGVYRKTGQWVRVVLNIGEYLARREAFIRQLAEKTADKVKYLKEPIALSPMEAKDRRLVHLALQNDPTVKTESVGEGEKRKVVIRLSES